MTVGIRTIVFPVNDIARAKIFFSALTGAKPVMDAAYYVAFSVGDQHVGLDPQGHRAGPLAYWHVGDVGKTIEHLVGAGGEVVEKAKDVGNGRLVASVKDAEGNLIGLIQPE